jgi:predicted DsbA family dithiol-disulfide isomerase
MSKGTIEIWSDIACPFCYIGKKKLEKALEDSGNADNFEIIWKSFQLDPSLEFQEGVTMLSSLAEKKGWTPEQTAGAFAQVQKMGSDYGLEFRFDKALPCNTLQGHFLIHLAQRYNVSDQVKEALFKAHFTSGENVSDLTVLKRIAVENGIPESDFEVAMSNHSVRLEVDKDIREAQQIGVRGVPFFVFNRSFAVSGAQPDEVFLSAINKALAGEA